MKFTTLRLSILLKMKGKKKMQITIDSANVKITNCEAFQTMADGFYITGVSSDICVNNCNCNSCC